ncbi:MAG: DUF2797 domain-containing protein [Gammaproteobacteria bacterium]
MTTGPLRKLGSRHQHPVDYQLRIAEQELALAPRLGQSFTLRFEGEIRCANCARLTRKSFSQGHCFPCSQRLAACDLCIVRPDRCHFDQGTCREPDWGQTHCMQPHFVYLANTSGLKVGITRAHQGMTRWIDQGASQALPILEASSRHVSGLAEVALAAHVADRTDWRAMLRGPAEDVDLAAEGERLLARCAPELDAIRARFGADCLRLLPDREAVRIEYPVLEYPDKIRSLNLDKTPEINGTLQGIKGQYLIFDTGVLNVRKFSAYIVSVEA